MKQKIFCPHTQAFQHILIKTEKKKLEHANSGQHTYKTKGEFLTPAMLFLSDFSEN